MTYIYEMASGTEYLGEEFSCPKQTADMTTPVSHPARGEYCAELRLALVETRPSGSNPSGFPAGLNLNELFGTSED